MKQRIFIIITAITIFAFNTTVFGQTFVVSRVEVYDEEDEEDIQEKKNRLLGVTYELSFYEEDIKVTVENDSMIFSKIDKNIYKCRVYNRYCLLYVEKLMGIYITSVKMKFFYTDTEELLGIIYLKRK